MSGVGSSFLYGVPMCFENMGGYELNTDGIPATLASENKGLGFWGHACYSDGWMRFLIGRHVYGQPNILLRFRNRICPVLVLPDSGLGVIP